MPQQKKSIVDGLANMFNNKVRAGIWAACAAMSGITACASLGAALVTAYPMFFGTAMAFGVISAAQYMLYRVESGKADKILEQVRGFMGFNHNRPQ